jgi:hypothetical protein
MRLRQLARRHPLLLTLLAFVIIDLPQWVAAVWSFFSKQPLMPTVALWLGTKRISSIAAMVSVMPHFSAYWITVPFGSLFLILVAIETWKTHQHRLAETGQSRLTSESALKPQPSVTVIQSPVVAYPAVDFEFVPERVYPNLPVTHMPALMFTANNTRGRYAVEELRMRVTEYNFGLRELAPTVVERLPENKIRVRSGKYDLVILSWRKAGEDSLRIERVEAGHKSDTRNLAELPPFQFIRPPDLSGPGPYPVRNGPFSLRLYAMRFTFVDLGTSRRYAFYKVIEPEEPYLLPLQNPRMGVMGHGTAGNHFPDLLTEPFQRVMAHQREIYAGFPEQELPR